MPAPYAGKISMFLTILVGAYAGDACQHLSPQDIPEEASEGQSLGQQVQGLGPGGDLVYR